MFIGLHLYNMRLSVLTSITFLSLKCPFRSTIEKIRLHEFRFRVCLCICLLFVLAHNWPPTRQENPLLQGEQSLKVENLKL